MKKLVLSFIFACAATAAATETIEGAFGLKLGDVFAPTTPPLSRNDVGVAYEFKPKIANPAFSSYLVFISPNSRLIYKIEAIHEQAGDNSGCSSFRDQMMALLRLKYEGKYDGNSSGSITQGKRMVDSANLGLMPERGCHFSIVYWDEELAARCVQERKENQVKDVLQRVKSMDATGL